MARLCHGLSYPFRSGFLHICLMWRIVPPVFSFSLEATIPYMAVDLACSWEEVSSGSSYIAIVNQNLQFLTLFHLFIHSFNKYVSPQNVPGTGLSTAGISVNKTDIVPLSNSYSCGRWQTTTKTNNYENCDKGNTMLLALWKHRNNKMCGFMVTKQFQVSKHMDRILEKAMFLKG